MNQTPEQPAFVLPLVDATAEDIGEGVDLYRPKGHGPAPAVVLVHGMPFPGDRPPPSQWPVYIGYGAQLARRGCAAAMFDHSDGSPDYESSAQRLARVIDTVRAHPRVDGDRLALWCFSGGGPLTAEYLGAPPPWLRAVAMTYPMLDEVLDFPVPVNMRPIQAVTHSGGLPVVLTACGRERPELAEAVDRFQAAALKAEVKVQLIDVPDGRHGFDCLDHTEQSRVAVTEALNLVTGHLEAV